MGKLSIGVVTMFRGTYGGFLQAFALQRILTNLNYETSLIDYDYSNEKSILGIPYLSYKNPIKYLIRVAIEFIRYPNVLQRKSVFEHSIQKNLITTPQYKRYKHLIANPPYFDIYLSGSDQVFNPNLEPQANESRLLNFTNGFKVSYAASAGTLSFNNIYKDRLLLALQGFEAISVREHSLCEFLKQHEIFSNVHVDPTLLLSHDEWVSFSKTPHIGEKYIFFYNIGNPINNYNIASKLSFDTGLPIFVADGYKKFENQIKRNKFLSPEEWVGAIYDAEYVVTNSFHGSIFSIIFNKKVIINKPENYSDRLDNIIKNCKLERLYDDTPLTDSELEPLYSYSHDYIARERLRAIEYLKSLQNLYEQSKVKR